MILDPRAPEPLYHQLRMDLLRRIESAEFGPGDRIPTEMEICDAYGVSRSTARQALGLLVDDDVLIRARRRGTIVNPAWRRTTLRDEVHLVLSDRYREHEIRESIPSNRRVRVDVVAYDEIREYLLRAIAEGIAPDVAMVDHVWIAEMAEGHMIHSLHDLDATWADSVLASSIHPSVAKGYVFDDALFAVPEEVNLAGVWYDRHLHELIGSPPLETWEDLAAAATAVREVEPGMYPIALPGGPAARETTTYCIAALLASNGTAIIDDAVTLDSSASVAGLRFLRGLVESGLVSPAVRRAAWLDAPEALGAGTTAFTFGGSYEAEHIAQHAGLTVAEVFDHYRFRPFAAGPDGREATVIGGMGYAIFRQSRDPYSALDLVKAITDPARLDARSAAHATISPTGRMPSAVDLDTGPHDGHILDSAWTRPMVATYPQVTRQVQRMVDSVISGALRPAAAVERAADFIGSVTDLPVVNR